MNTDSVSLRRVPNPLPVGHKTQPGDFSWDTAFEGKRYLYICLPGDTSMSAIQVQQGSPGGPRVWGWDGNEDKPTVTPSIHYIDHWHGWLRAGRLESC